MTFQSYTSLDIVHKEELDHFQVPCFRLGIPYPIKVLLISALTSHVCNCYIILPLFLTIFTVNFFSYVIIQNTSLNI
jgi:hypothetical protein